MTLRVVCIDDSKSVHAFLRECLKDVAIEYKPFYDGEEGVEFFKNNTDTAFDLIFLDWEMPKKNGPEVLNDLQRMGIKIPVVMLTSKNGVRDIAQMFERGVAEYILKPFTRDIILSKISGILPISHSA